MKLQMIREYENKGSKVKLQAVQPRNKDDLRTYTGIDSDSAKHVSPFKEDFPFLNVTQEIKDGIELQGFGGMTKRANASAPMIKEVTGYEKDDVNMLNPIRALITGMDGLYVPHAEVCVMSELLLSKMGLITEPVIKDGSFVGKQLRDIKTGFFHPS